MEQYRNVVQDRSGNAIAGATVTVTSYPGDGAVSIYTSNSAVGNANPLTTDSFGNFAFYAKDGAYNINISKTNVISQAYTNVILKDESGWVSVKGFGAIGDGVTDDTAAIQAAINTTKSVYFPNGTYKITAKLTFNTIGQIFYGASMEESVISLTGAIKGFESSGSLVRCNFRDLKITGDNTSLDGIDVSSGNLYESNWKNLVISVGGRAIYAPVEFANTFQNIQFSSYNNHGIEVEGNSGSSYIGCYAHDIPTAGKVGFRVYGGGTFLSCNGIDSGAAWGLFGQKVTKGDAVDTQFSPVFIRCNFEDFTKEGVRLRYNGKAIFLNCTFFPPAAGTYDCSVYSEYCDALWEFHGTATSSKGATRNKQAELFSDGGQAPLSIASYTTWDNNGVLSTIGNTTTALVEYSKYAQSVTLLNMGRGYGFYSPVPAAWTPGATTFSVTSIDRVATANVGATNLDQATGGVNGQILTIHVKDANTTIRHNQGGAGRFMNSTAANIAATNGRPYQYVSDGTIWWQI